MAQTNFISDFKNTLIDKLNDYQGGTYYACDLSSTLFEGENANGSVLCSTYQTKEFIKANFDLFGDLVEYCQDNMDMALNPFSEPEKAHVILLLEASSAILSKCPLIDKNWNNEIELTPKVIKTLIKQINALDIDDEDLF
ncbi:MAG: hypothetical protein RLZZ605_664 [Bacteroidota bacterium]|jgi:hypothetical protein